MVSADAVRERLRELSGPIVRLVERHRRGPTYFARMTDRLLDAAARVLDRARRDGIAMSRDARLPRHVAVIMDGNGRWAERQGLARTDGHSQGEERLAEIVRAADALGIGWLTAYGFSTENWRRPRLEVDFILGLHKKIFGRAPGDAREQREDPLDRSRHAVPARASPPSCGARSRSRPASPQHNTGLNFTVAFDYGGRQELVEAGAGHRDRATRADRHRNRAPPPLRARAPAGRPHGPDVG